MIRHHPPRELLMDYASGSALPGIALVVATHAASCRRCAAEVARLEAVGGELLLTSAEQPVAAHLLPDLLARLDEPERVSQPRPAFDVETCKLLPTPLRRYLGRNLGDLDWRRIAGIFDEVPLPLSSRGEKASLLRLMPACPVPPHSHYGHELILVLDGGFVDEDGQYNRGDFATLYPGDVHHPVIDGESGCMCLVVVDGPVRLLDGTDIFSDPSWV